MLLPAFSIRDPVMYTCPFTHTYKKNVHAAQEVGQPHHSVVQGTTTYVAFLVLW